MRKANLPVRICDRPRRDYGGYDGALGMEPLGFGVLCGAITTSIAGLIEAAGSGVMVGEGISGFANMLTGLGITNIPGSIGALLLAALLKYRPTRTKAPIKEDQSLIAMASPPDYPDFSSHSSRFSRASFR